MRLMTWDADGVRKFETIESAPAPGEHGFFWLDLDLRSDPAEATLAGLIAAPAGSMGDLREPHARAKVVEAGRYLYVLLHEAGYDDRREIKVVNAHFYIAPDFLISIHEEAPCGLESVWAQEPALVAQKGVDYLFFLIADAMVERSFPALDSIAETVEETEDKVFPYPAEGVQAEIFDLRKDLLNLRRTIGPMREALATLTRRENPLVDREAALLLGEVYDHLVRLYELIDTHRDLLGSLMDIYLTGLSNRLNEIMRTLTVIATIMMPLSVIVGLYGMNFRYMPELGWRWGYPTVLAVMLLVSGGMVMYFRRKKWF